MKSLFKIAAILMVVVFSFCLISCPSPDNEPPAGNTPSGSGSPTSSGSPAGNNPPSGTPQSQTPTTYSIAVTNGTASPTSAAAGDTVTITANSAPSGQVFNGWTTTTEGVTFANASSTTTTFTMPARDVSVTATYAAQTYSISVTGGTANPTTATAGTTVTITVNSAPSGQVFNGWSTTTEGISFANASSTTTTFTMPAQNVTIRANYATCYNITCYEDATANMSSAIPGTTVTLTARVMAPSGNYIDWQWSPSSLFFTNPYGYQTTFVMPAQDVSVGAMCVNGQCYEIEVNVSDCGGEWVSNPTVAPVGHTVILQSKPDIENGYHTEWVGSQGVSFSNTTGDTTTFIMPDHAVSIEVRYVRDN